METLDIREIFGEYEEIIPYSLDPTAYQTSRLVPELEEGEYLLTFRTVLFIANDQGLGEICTGTGEIESIYRTIVRVESYPDAKQVNEIGVSQSQGYGVKPFTGAFIHSHTDLSIPRRG
jgi:hypothetical protein